MDNKKRNDIHNICATSNRQYYSCLTEQDFYPPEDNRTVKSYVVDIYGGDNFTDYCEEFFELLEEEGYYD